MGKYSAINRVKPLLFAVVRVPRKNAAHRTHQHRFCAAIQKCRYNCFLPLFGLQTPPVRNYVTTSVRIGATSVYFLHGLLPTRHACVPYSPTQVCSTLKSSHKIITIQTRICDFCLRETTTKRLTTARLSAKSGSGA